MSSSPSTAPSVATTVAPVGLVSSIVRVAAWPRATAPQLNDGASAQRPATAQRLPWHVLPEAQTPQVAPAVPHRASMSPAWQTPLESQQPAQLIALQAPATEPTSTGARQPARHTANSPVTRRFMSARLPYLFRGMGAGDSVT